MTAKRKDEKGRRKFERKNKRIQKIKTAGT
jgi:hypothetical protein